MAYIGFCLASLAQHSAFEIPCMLLHFFSVVHFVFLLSSIPVCLYHNLFIHSPVSGDSSCFQFEAIIINADVNIVYKSLCRHLYIHSFFLSKCLGVELLDLMFNIHFTL